MSVASAMNMAPPDVSPPQAYLLRACQVPRSKLHQKLLQATQVIISLVKERESLSVELQEWRKGRESLSVELQEWRKGRGRSEHQERGSRNCSGEKCPDSQLAPVAGPPKTVMEEAGSQDRTEDNHQVHEIVSEPGRTPERPLELSLQSLQFSDSSELESVQRVLQLVDNSGLTSGLEPRPRASTPRLKEPDLQTSKQDHSKLPNPNPLQSEQPLSLQGNRMSAKPRPLQPRPAGSQRRRAQASRKTQVRNYNLKDS